MIDKKRIKELIENNKYEEALEIFASEYLGKLKEILEKNNISIKEDISLIEAMMYVDVNIPNSEIITHVISETVFLESRELVSRVNYALNWYDRWLENVQNILN